MNKTTSFSNLKLKRIFEESYDTTSSETESNSSSRDQYDEEADYGFFVSDVTTNVPSISAFGNMTEPSTPSSSERRNDWDYTTQSYLLHMQKLTAMRDSLGEARVLFTYSNRQSSVICRSFSSINFDYQDMQVSLQGFRIVQYPSGIRVDFQLFVESNGVFLKLWKRYTEFEHFANFLGEIGDSLHDTQASWYELVTQKTWFRNLSVPYLIKKMLRLEHFLRCAIFELKSPIPFLFFLGSSI
jgi:hypothetical protein